MQAIKWAALGGALAALVALGGAPGASAHGGRGMYVTMDGYRGARPLYYRRVRPAPRVRRYSYRPSRAIPGSCGQFRYWNKGRCLDARTNPPSLK